MLNNDRQILILAINYNTDNYALNFVNSLSKYLNKNIHCILVDNTERESSEPLFSMIKETSSWVLPIQTTSNLGYFGAAKYGFEQYLKRHKEYPDWVIISNVDLEFVEPHFFQILSEMEDLPELGVVAPQIWSRLWKRDLNPKILYRPSNFYMRYMQAVFSNYYFYSFHALSSVLKNVIKRCISYLSILIKNTKSSKENLGKNYEIYAPHGSFIIFHKRFFQRGGSLDYPSFLFGEEIFVAETAMKLGLKVVYNPKLRINDYEHVSTGLFKNKKLASYFRDSMNSLVERYFI